MGWTGKEGGHHQTPWEPLRALTDQRRMRPKARVRPRRTNQSLGTKPAAACVVKGLTPGVGRARQGEAFTASPQQPHSNLRTGRRTPTHFRPTLRLQVSRLPACHVAGASKRENRAPVPGGELFSLLGKQRAVSSSRRLRYSDSSGVLSSAGRWAAQAELAQGLEAASGGAARGKGSVREAKNRSKF